MDIDFTLKVLTTIASIITCVGVLGALHYIHKDLTDLYICMSYLTKNMEKLTLIVKFREEADESKKTL